MYLGEKAARAYYEISLLSCLIDLISIQEFFLRLSILKSLIDPDRSTNIFLDKLAIDYKIEFEYIEEESVAENESQPENNGPSKSGNKDDDDFLHLLRNGKYQWDFHKGDPDPFPSVPHGHAYEKHKDIKLDPFRGGIYSALTKKRLNKEDKKFITTLWTDNNFREFAYEAIDHFMNEQPYYDLVRNRRLKLHSPLILPYKK